MSNEAITRVFKRLADRLQGVVTDISMITINAEFSAHFLEVHVKKTEGGNFVGDRIRFLVLNLSLSVRDMDAGKCANERPRFGRLAVTQKLRAYNIIRVLNIIKLKLYNIM
jgi:hypothetical protein